VEREECDKGEENRIEKRERRKKIWIEKKKVWIERRKDSGMM
jgi:hypothetical protein